MGSAGCYVTGAGRVHTTTTVLVNVSEMQDYKGSGEESSNNLNTNQAVFTHNPRELTMENRQGRQPGELRRLTDKQLVAIFEQQKSDSRVLNALNDELKKRHSDDAVDLHVKVASALRQLARAKASSGINQAAGQGFSIEDWLHKFLASRNLAMPPQYRPLYRYRMNDEEYEMAKKILQLPSTLERLIQPGRHSGALFVTYCAEWFRRESPSTFLRWEDPAPERFPLMPYFTK